MVAEYGLASIKEEGNQAGFQANRRPSGHVLISRDEHLQEQATECEVLVGNDALLEQRLGLLGLEQYLTSHSCQYTQALQAGVGRCSRSSERGNIVDGEDRYRRVQPVEEPLGAVVNHTAGEQLCQLRPGSRNRGTQCYSRLWHTSAAFIRKTRLNTPPARSVLAASSA
jgi:hypothetical protein